MKYLILVVLTMMVLAGCSSKKSMNDIKAMSFDEIHREYENCLSSKNIDQEYCGHIEAHFHYMEHEKRVRESMEKDFSKSGK